MKTGLCVLFVFGASRGEAWEKPGAGSDPSDQAGGAKTHQAAGGAE